MSDDQELEILKADYAVASNLLRRIFDHSIRAGAPSDTCFTDMGDGTWDGYIDINLCLSDNEVSLLDDLGIEPFGVCPSCGMVACCQINGDTVRHCTNIWHRERLLR